MNGAAAGRARTALPLVILLALAIFLHALDRGNFSTAAPLIKDDLGFSNTQIGLLLSVFFWAYVPAHLLAGWLIDRIGAVMTLTLGVALWGCVPESRHPADYRFPMAAYGHHCRTGALGQMPPIAGRLKY